MTNLSKNNKFYLIKVTIYLQTTVAAVSSQASSQDTEWSVEMVTIYRIDVARAVAIPILSSLWGRPTAHMSSSPSKCPNCRKLSWADLHLHPRVGVCPDLRRSDIPVCWDGQLAELSTT